jgi:hypothetical protein
MWIKKTEQEIARATDVKRRQEIRQFEMGGKVNLIGII